MAFEKILETDTLNQGRIKINNNYDAVGDQVSQLSESIVEISDDIYIDFKLTQNQMLEGKYYSNLSVGVPLKTTNDTGSYYTEAVDVSKYVGRYLHFSFKKINNGSRAFGFLDKNNIIRELFFEKSNLFVFNETTGLYEGNLLISYPRFFFSYSKVADEISITSRNMKKDVSDTRYVSTDGLDSNDGTLENPFKTVNRALLDGASKIAVFGGIYEQQIDLIYAKNKNITISAYNPAEKVIFTESERVLVTKANLSTGRKKTYFADTSKTLETGNKWIYQDGVADETTLISDADRHPLQRGYKHRCFDTKIEKCNSTDLTSALDEIESSESYKWFKNSNTIYFSSPKVVSSENPICFSCGKELFLNASRDINLNLIGIETKYLIINLDETGNSKAIDCKSSNNYGDGCFTYDKSIGVEFIRCEATRCCNNNNGDGFNGHGDNVGDAFAKQVTASLIECWSHDNRDDGYSDHERSEVTIYGGLYEYNGKGGVTPSYGSHCVCSNVYARNNYVGFYYTGETATAEGGKYGQMICYGCVSENNADNPVYGSGKGFAVDGANNKMICVDCKSIGNHFGFASTNATSRAELIDCGSKNDTTAKYGNNFTIKNTNVIS